MSRARPPVRLTLSRCHDLGHLIAVRCHWCRGPARIYRPADVARLLGDVPVDRLDRRLVCERCGRRDYLTIDALHRDAGALQGASVRRLVRVRLVRRPVWRDEPL